MARIVLIPGTIRSKLITTMALCARLEAAGHDVALVAPPGPVLDESGLDFVPADLTARPSTAPAGLVGRVRERWEALWSARELPRSEAERLDVAGFQARLAGLAPQLVLVDIEAHEHIMAVVRANHRVALVSVFFNLWKRPGMPPLHVANAPGSGISGTRAGIELAWLRYRAWRILERLRARTNPRDYATLLEAYARHVGFALEEEVDYGQALLPFVYRRLPVLTLNMRELEFPHDPHPASTYVGPMVGKDRSRLAFSGGERKTLDALAEVTRERLSAGRRAKLVYCTSGAYYRGDDRGFWGALVRSIAARPDWIGILGLGARLDPAALGPLPENVLAFRWVPQVQVLAHADCAVIHGGMTTVYECIDAMVPMVLYPYADSFDQLGTASRVRYHGLGLVGDRARDGPAEIERLIDRALTSEETGGRLGRMRESMLRYAEQRAVEQAVEALLSARPGASAALRQPGIPSDRAGLVGARQGPRSMR